MSGKIVSTGRIVDTSAQLPTLIDNGIRLEELPGAKIARALRARGLTPTRIKVTMIPEHHRDVCRFLLELEVAQERTRKSRLQLG